MARLLLPLGLLYAMAFLSCGVPSVFAECPLSQWQNWQPVNLTIDSKPNDLAVQALKGYIQGLEQTAPDIRCPWRNATAHVETACMHVETGSVPRYAVRFTYSVPCIVTDPASSTAPQTNTTQSTVIQGTIEGVLPSSSATGNVANSAPVAEPVLSIGSPAAEALP